MEERKDTVICSDKAAWQYLLKYSSPAFSKVGPTALLFYRAPWLREKGGMLMEVVGTRGSYLLY